ncbi:MAG: RNA-binding protein, partial [Bacteroidetes bacterium]
MRSYTICPVVLAVLFAFTSCSHRETLFRLVPPDDSGVEFRNVIQEDEFFNILNYEYLYNGGGVAIGDFNNDGWQDLYFTGNMVGNRLYLNRGDLRFEDVTEKAGVAAAGKWSTGVAAVDINADGLLDLYVCASTLSKPEDRANLLFLNQGPDAEGIPTFREAAHEYGIADDGYSTHAAFFDYDNDGDLDLYVLTNQIERLAPNKFRFKRLDGSAPTTDRLYRNNGDGTFTNVSREAGILIEGYGLGLAIFDVNRDGWKDIYVSNDYITNDLLYVNNGDGTFTNKAGTYFKHTSHFAMGNDIADINNDGWEDIYTLDMLPEDNQRQKQIIPENRFSKYVNSDKLGYEYQYMRNTLQLNNGFAPDGQQNFSEIGLFAQVYATDWSWAPLFADFDHDGWRDLYVTNGFPKDITDLDFASYREGKSMAFFKEDLLNAIPQVKISNYAFRNTGDLRFQNVTKEWGLSVPSYSNGAAYGDLDNDGDLDLVLNNLDEEAFIFENTLRQQGRPDANYLRLRLKGTPQNPFGFGATVVLKVNGYTLINENSPYRGYLSTMEPFLHFGVGAARKVDTLIVEWHGYLRQVLTDVPVNQVLELRIEDARPFIPEPPRYHPLFREISDSLGIQYYHFEHVFTDFNIQRTVPHQYSQQGPAISVGDLNGDGRFDFFTGGSLGVGGSFALQDDGLFRVEYFGKDHEKNKEDLGTLLFDADNDGDLDLYIASGSSEQQLSQAAYQDRLLVNDGRGGFVVASKALPPIAVSTSCVKAADYDRDGDLDLFVGGRIVPGEYPKPTDSYILRNESEPGKPRFVNATPELCPELLGIGLVSDALWTDFDQDGWMDLLLAGEWMPLTFLRNKEGMAFENVTAATGLQNLTGWWNSLAAGDFDDDGDLDYLAGNLGLNSHYQASEEHPVMVFAGDFDDNGGYDAIVVEYKPDANGELKPYPMHSKDDLTKQMVWLKKRFLKYADYGRATIYDLLTPEELDKAMVLKATWLANSYVENLGPGPDGLPRFALKPLPTPAQLAPLYGMMVQDFNDDGRLDVLAVGNSFAPEVFWGRLDALNGLL